MAGSFSTPLDPALAQQVERLSEAERETFEERAGIRQYLGGLDRQTAEKLAWQDVLDLRQRQANSDDGAPEAPKPSP